jgi:glycosyltransferase involved in cell wall biosynthesis
MEALVRLERARIVLSEHNVESDYWLGEFRRTHQLGRLIDYAIWHRYERCCWHRADRVTMVTERDAARVRLVRPHGVGVVPNGVATERFRYLPPSHRQGSDILFVGVMSYEPNIQAAIRLARRVMPRVRRRVPDARLTIAGRDPDPRVRALANERVRVTGAVDDLAALFDRHAAYANLVAFGGGGSLKTLEPLCAGLPLVASRFAIRGYELQPRRHLLLATHDDDVAEALCRVLTERAGFDAMAEQAHAWVQQHDWGIYARRFADFVTAACLVA